MKNKLVEEILIALSLANLLFITSWATILFPTNESYHLKQYASTYLGLILSVLIAAGIFISGLQVSRLLNKGKTPWIVKLIFLGVIGVALNGVRIQFYNNEIQWNFYLKIFLITVACFICILTLLKWQEFLFNLSKKLLLLLVPFIVITFSQAILGMLNGYPGDVPIENQLATISPKVKANIKNRVIWIIFDELDYFVPFGESSVKIDLPEFTKLKNESLFATQATSPAHFTLEAIPSFLTGRKVKKSNLQGKNDLRLSYERTEDTVSFSEAPNIFTKIREMGGGTALVGWYHPYCRTLKKDLSACHWESLDSTQRFDKDQLSRLNEHPMSKILLKNFANCLISLPFGYRLFKIIDSRLQEDSQVKAYIKRHYRMLADSKQVILNPNIDIALLHLPTPHFPSYFKSSTNEFVSSETSYIDNLVLSDKVLGELRESLEDSNLWQDSTIIVTSDHQWRIDSYRDWLSKEELAIAQGVEHPNIPFILKLKGNNEGLIYDKPFNTVITHDLILAIMKGEISSTEEVKMWLDNNSDR